MSAMNVFVGNHRVDVFTDTLIYDLANGGAVAGFGSKVIPLPHHGAIMTGTGYTWIVSAIAGVVSSSGMETFDDLVEGMAATVRHAVSQDQTGISATFGNFEIAIAGFSEARNQAEAYVLYGYRRDGWPPFRMQKVGKYVSPPIRVPAFDNADPEASGIAILEAQRKTRVGTNDAPSGQILEMHAVGGAAQHTVVTRDGISIRVLKRWSDEVGKPVAA